MQLLRYITHGFRVISHFTFFLIIEYLAIKEHLKIHENTVFSGAYQMWIQKPDYEIIIIFLTSLLEYNCFTMVC